MHQRDAIDQAPVRLFAFMFGEGDELFLTDADEDVFHNFQKFTKEAITISTIEENGEASSQEVKIQVARDSPVALRFVDFPPSAVVGIQVYEGHFHDIDREFQLHWSGSILNLEVTDYEAEFVCRPGSASVRSLGLRRNYQKQCPHMLYGSECRAVRVPVAVTFQSSGGFTGRVNFPPMSDPQGAFSGGLIEWVEEGRKQIRTILTAEFSNSNADLIMSGPGPVNSGIAATMLRGCQHTEESCIDWHNNILNYGGQLWIPFTNPINSITEYL